MCPHADLLLGRAVSLDPEHKLVHVTSQAGEFAVGYERLVVALGSITSTPNVPGLREHSLGLKDIGDAIRLRNHVLRQLDLADADPASAERRLTFVFAGAGFAGVEAVAELQELTEGALRRHPRLAGVRPRWVLVDSGPRILGQVPDSLARFAARTLSGRGVEILSSTALVSIDRGGAVLSDGRRIETGTVVWTAGVAANPIAAQLGLPLDARGRIPVDELFRVNGMDDVLALGDIAAVPNEATGELDPPTCRHALRQARRLSRNLRGILGWTVARGYHLMALPFVARRMNLAIANANWVLAGHSTWFYNPIAAVPSLHCGFAMALGIAVAAAVRRRWLKLLALGWGPLVALSTVATANHYVFDVAAGLAITAVGYAIAVRPRVAREVAYA
jgi:NADH dehydrogenase